MPHVLGMAFEVGRLELQLLDRLGRVGPDAAQRLDRVFDAPLVEPLLVPSRVVTVTADPDGGQRDAWKGMTLPLSSVVGAGASGSRLAPWELERGSSGGDARGRGLPSKVTSVARATTSVR